MISANNISLQYGKRVLFDEVNISFKPGNCYGIIGANGAGKSTFLKILSGDKDPNLGHITIEPGKRMAVLNQDHNAFDEFQVIDTVMMGHKILWDLMKEKDCLVIARKAAVKKKLATNKELDKIDEEVTHVIVHPFDLSRITELRQMNRKRDRKFHIVSHDWILDSLEKVQILKEEDYETA